MRVLLDEAMSRRFGRQLTGHEVRTAPQMGWASVGNGELLRLAAAAGFDALVTVDRNIEYQQNVARVGLAMIVLIARSNSIPDQAPLAPLVLRALESIQPGQIVHVRA